jgi:diguanylate cyclase (GGDEF)-like protein
MTAASRPAAGITTKLVSVVLLAITIVAATQLVVAGRLTAHAAVQDAVREVAGAATAIEHRAAVGVADPVAADAAAHDAISTIEALPGVQGVTLRPARDTTLDAFAVRVLADRRAAADGPAVDGVVRVAATVEVGGMPRVLEMRIDTTPAARSALGSRLAAAGLVALGLAAVAGVALLVARRRLRTRHSLAVRAAFTDDLTGLPNRRAFLRRLTVAVRQARAGGAPLTLALLDVTGHEPAGSDAGCRHGDDDLLGEVAQVLADGGRVGTEAFRLGGSSFALLLADTDADQAYAVTRELRDRIEAAAGPLAGVAGLCVLGPHSPDADALLAGAEAALRDAHAVAAPAPVAVEVPEPRATRPPVAQVAAAYAAAPAADEFADPLEEGLGLRAGGDPWDIRWITGWDS